jgi:hypothetical protein
MTPQEKSPSEVKNLEIEYTPSLFTKRFASRDELLQHFIHFSKSGKLSTN